MRYIISIIVLVLLSMSVHAGKHGNPDVFISEEGRTTPTEYYISFKTHGFWASECELKTSTGEYKRFTVYPGTLNFVTLKFEKDFRYGYYCN